MIKVIINADDLGLNPEVNKKIDDALSCGYITSSTILSNTNYIEEVIQIVKKYPSASFGVHLNLTEGRSLTRNPIFAKLGIIDENGCFIMKQSLKICLNPGQELREAIKQEWIAQIELLLRNGITLSHADGHHHCHSWYGLTDVFTEIMTDYGINKARQRYRYPEKENLRILIKGIVSRLCNILNINIYEQNNIISRHFAPDTYTIVFNKKLKNCGIRTPMFFCSYNDMLRIISASRLGLEDGDVIELMCHPGSERYAQEYDNIRLDKNNMLHNSKYQLISYNEF